MHFLPLSNQASSIPDLDLDFDRPVSPSQASTMHLTLDDAMNEHFSTSDRLEECIARLRNLKDHGLEGLLIRIQNTQAHKDNVLRQIRAVAHHGSVIASDMCGLADDILALKADRTRSTRNFKNRTRRLLDETERMLVDIQECVEKLKIFEETLVQLQHDIDSKIAEYHKQGKVSSRKAHMYDKLAAAIPIIGYLTAAVAGILAGLCSTILPHFLLALPFIFYAGATVTPQLSNHIRKRGRMHEKRAMKPLETKALLERARHILQENYEELESAGQWWFQIKNDIEGISQTLKLEQWSTKELKEGRRGWRRLEEDLRDYSRTLHAAVSSGSQSSKKSSRSRSLLPPDRRISPKAPVPNIAVVTPRTSETSMPNGSQRPERTLPMSRSLSRPDLTEGSIPRPSPAENLTAGRRGRSSWVESDSDSDSSSWTESSAGRRTPRRSQSSTPYLRTTTRSIDEAISDRRRYRSHVESDDNDSVVVIEVPESRRAKEPRRVHCPSPPITIVSCDSDEDEDEDYYYERKRPVARKQRSYVWDSSHDDDKQYLTAASGGSRDSRGSSNSRRSSRRPLVVYLD